MRRLGEVMSNGNVLEEVDVASGPPGSQGPPGNDGAPGAPGAQGVPGPPGTTLWALITDVPATFAPSAHATAHQPGGADAMAVDAAAATGSLRTLGTGSAQAAAGDHTHAGGSTPAYAPGSFTVATEQYALLVRHLKLTGTQRATVQGTGTVRIT